MTRTAVELGCLAWVKAVFAAGLAPADVNARVIFADGQGPRPALPYLTVQLIASPNDGEPTTHDLYNAGTDQVDRLVVQRQSASVRVQAYGPGAMDMLAALQLSVSNESVIRANTAAGIEVRGTLNAVQLIGRFSGGVPESRAVVDFEVGHAITSEHAEGYIDTADITSLDPSFTVTVTDL